MIRRMLLLMALCCLPALALPAAGPDLGVDLKGEDYDALYALLQKYRDELNAMTSKKEQYEKELQDLNERMAAMAQQMDQIRPLDGMKIHGRILSYYDDFNAMGSGAQGLEAGHFRDAVQRAELELTYTRGLLRGLVEYDFQYIFGNQYDGPVLLGVDQVPTQSGLSQGARQIYVEILTPLQVRVGYLDYAQTPLTFWRNEDPDPFAPELFAERRQRLRQDLLLSDDHHQELRGLRLLGDAVLGSGHALHFSALLTQLATTPADPTNPGINTLYEGSGASPEDLFEPYATYLGAWMLHYATPGGWLGLGIQGSYLGEAPGGSTWLAPSGAAVEPSELMVNSASLDLSPTAWLSAGAEAAFSHFHAPVAVTYGLDPSFDSQGDLDGSALNAHLRLDIGWLALHGSLIQVGQGFNSAAAQGRTWDASQSPMGPFETENSRFDPESGGFGDLRAPRAPETIYNRAILPPIAWVKTGVNVYSPVFTRLPYDPAVNALDPYGLATPNRQRFGGGADVRLFQGGLLLSGAYDLASEIQGEGSLAPENFVRLLAGSRLDLLPLLHWPLRASASFSTESTHNGGWVAFDAAKVQAGAEMDAWKGGTLQAAFRHLDFNGVLPYHDPGPFAPADPVLLAFGRVAEDGAYDQWAVGLRHRFGDDLTLWINYSLLTYANALAGPAASATESRPGFQVGQGYVRLALGF
jgi:hypothetical protein